MKLSLDKIQINEMQNMWLNVYGKYDIEKSMLWMTEEFGEVIAAIRKGNSKEDISGEIGDLTAWIISLCNILDIELSKALESTLKKEVNRQLDTYGKLKYVQNERNEHLVLSILDKRKVGSKN